MQTPETVVPVENEFFSHEYYNERMWNKVTDSLLYYILKWCSGSVFTIKSKVLKNNWKQYCTLRQER